MAFHSSSSSSSSRTRYHDKHTVPPTVPFFSCLLLLLSSTLLLSQQASSLHPSPRPSQPRRLLRHLSTDTTTPTTTTTNSTTSSAAPPPQTVYTIGVLAIRGNDSAYEEFNSTFATYLTATAGQALDPPVRFEMQPVTFKTLYQEATRMDFIYLNPSAYSCIESEFGAQSLVSQISRRKIEGNVYHLTKFGGVILARADNTEVNHITDLEGKVAACASISGLGSGQMQFREMKLNGLNHFTSLKQLVLTSNQGKVVHGVLNGDFDVGFVRTDQVERTKDANGTLLDKTLFKTIDPQPNLTIEGVPFPFQSSTPLYPEWNLAANVHVQPLVSEQVQKAMLAIDNHASVYGEYVACMEIVNNTAQCNDMLRQQLQSDTWADFNSSMALAELANLASTTGKYAGWRTTLSYMQLRSMQEATGFINRDPHTNTWRCVRTSELYDAITCPAEWDKKSKQDVENGCANVGLPCPDEFNCICNPCVRPLVCENNYVKLNGRCVSYGVIVAICLAPIVLVSIFGVRWYVQSKRRAADSVWRVEPSELEFGNPPEVIGEGSFGRVLLADYRGTKVAVKRIVSIPQRASDTDGMSSVSGSIGCDEGPVFAGSCFTDGGFLKADDPEMKDKNIFIIKASTSSPSKTTGLDHSNGTGGDDSEHTGKSRRSRVSEAFSNRSSKGLKADFVREMRHLSKLRHPCITTVMGAVISRCDEPMLIMEWMPHGSLYDVLRSETVHLEGQQYHAILCDIIQGIRFLHTANPQILHGDLKTKNILIDLSFRAKVADFGLSQKVKNGICGTPFWLAPELLRGESVNTAASDIYSFGIILNEIYSRKNPYEGETETEQEILRMIANPAFDKRPNIPDTCPSEAKTLMCQCWEADPEERPTAEDVDLHIKMLAAADFAPIGSKTKNQVLYDVFPRHIADALEAGKSVEPEWHESVAIYFSDIVGFTKIAGTFSPIKVSSLLDRLYKAFDDLSVKHDIFKIETTGDAYMAVSNLVKDQSEDYVKRIAEFALDAVKAANATPIDPDDPSRGNVQIRVGFHCGPVVSNVVGNLNPKFGIFGDSVNTSARMESTSQLGRIQCSDTAAELLRVQAQSSIVLSPRGHIDVKGKGEMATYWVYAAGEDIGDPSIGNGTDELPQSATGYHDSLVSLMAQETAPTAPISVGAPAGEPIQRSGSDVDC